MKSSKQDVSLVLVSALSLVLGWSSGADAKDLAKVNDRTITDKDVKQAVVGMNEGQKQQAYKDVNARRQALLGLIDTEVAAIEAEKLKLDQDPAFKEAMTNVRKQLLASQLLERKVASQVTQSAAKKFYDLNRDRYSTTQVRIQHILLNDEAEAGRIYEQAKDPKTDFQDLAEKHSKDVSAKNNRGDLGFVTRQTFVKEFSEPVFAAGEGDIVGPIRTNYGYHVVKVIQKRFGKPLEFEEVELQVKNDLRQQLLRNYLDNLKKQAKIKVDNQALESL